MDSYVTYPVKVGSVPVEGGLVSVHMDARGGVAIAIPIIRMSLPCTGISVACRR